MRADWAALRPLITMAPAELRDLPDWPEFEALYPRKDRLRKHEPHADTLFTVHTIYHAHDPPRAHIVRGETSVTTCHDGDNVPSPQHTQRTTPATQIRDAEFVSKTFCFFAAHYLHC